MMTLDHVGDHEAIVYAQLGQQPLARTTETSLERSSGTLSCLSARLSDLATVTAAQPKVACVRPSIRIVPFVYSKRTAAARFPRSRDGRYTERFVAVTVGPLVEPRGTTRTGFTDRCASTPSRDGFEQFGGRPARKHTAKFEPDEPAAWSGAQMTRGSGAPKRVLSAEDAIPFRSHSNTTLYLKAKSPREPGSENRGQKIFYPHQTKLK